MTRVDSSFSASCVALEPDHDRCDDISPLSKYDTFTDSFLPPGWNDSFKKISDLKIIYDEIQEPSCVTVGSSVSLARQTLDQVRANPWRFTYADIEFLQGALEESEFQAWFSEDTDLKRRYTDVYQPFHFYNYVKEDFLRLKNTLLECLTSFDKNTQSLFEKLIHHIDGILQHGRYDADDVYFAAKVNIMAAILSEISGDRFLYKNNEIIFDERLVNKSADLEKVEIDKLVKVLGMSLENPDAVSTDEKLWGNVQILSLLDPMLSVPYYFLGSVCDLEKFTAFWDYLDQVLQGKFNFEDSHKIVTALDEALARDLGDERRFLDVPTLHVLKSILARFKYELSPKTVCNTDSALLKIVDVLDDITQALFWDYNASDQAEAVLHSRFNPGSFYTKPIVTIRDVFSLRTLNEISTFSKTVDYYVIQDNAHDLYEILISLHYLVVDDSSDADKEEYVQHHWNNRDALRILEIVYDELAKKALEVNDLYPEPIFGISQELLKTRLNAIQVRLTQRIAEIQMEEDLL